MDLPAVPALPGDEASEDRQQTNRGFIRIRPGAPTPIGPKGNTAERRRRVVAKPAAALQLPENGRIGRPAFAQDLGIGPVGARPRPPRTRRCECA